MDAMQRQCFSNWTVDVLLNGGAVDLQLQYMYLTEEQRSDAGYVALLSEGLGQEWR